MSPCRNRSLARTEVCRQVCSWPPLRLIAHVHKASSGPNLLVACSLHLDFNGRDPLKRKMFRWHCQLSTSLQLGDCVRIFQMLPAIKTCRWKAFHAMRPRFSTHQLVNATKKDWIQMSLDCDGFLCLSIASFVNLADLRTCTHHEHIMDCKLQ